MTSGPDQLDTSKALVKTLTRRLNQRLFGSAADVFPQDHSLSRGGATIGARGSCTPHLFKKIKKLCFYCIDPPPSNVLTPPPLKSWRRPCLSPDKRKYCDRYDLADNSCENSASQIPPCISVPDMYLMVKSHDP